MAGLYVHIPYCRSKCAYCDFYSSPNTSQLNKLIEAIAREWQLRRNEVCEPIETIYIGGGTPSLLSPDAFRKLAQSLPISKDIKEFTIEANPDDITPELVSTWTDCGVGRVSMGIQSFDDSQLQALGRRHNAQQAINAVDTIRKHGIDNISLDLIYGLPNQSLDSWKFSLSTLLNLNPQHFSAYMLSFEPGTRLYAQLITGKVSEADEDLIEQMYFHLCEAAAKAGYTHYEISNFALPAHKAIHNSNYWKFLPYIGLGPSAHSFDGNSRRINPANIKKYLLALEANHIAAEIEDESSTERLNDMIMVGLRTAEGLDLNMLSTEQRDAFIARSKSLPPDHLLITNDRAQIPEYRYLISDAIIRTLLA